MRKFYKVAVNTPFNNSILIYASEKERARGDLVKVPLGKTRVTQGCILSEYREKINLKEIKEIKEEIEGISFISEQYLSFLEWVAHYYHYPLGQHIFDILPKMMKRPKEVEFLFGEDQELEYELTFEQQKCRDAILKEKKGHKKFLLHGVTGSGKTSVYIEVIRRVIKSGKNILFLVPEINLTPQFLNILKKYIPGKILSYHSGLTNSERYRTWKLLHENQEPYIMVGVRSSIFLPYKNLGFIIIDEEHDLSFKQEDRCSYNARDIAIKLASMRNIPILLGSATPSVETYFNSQRDGEVYLRMEKRPKGLKLPQIEIIDSRSSRSKDIVEEELIWPFSKKSLIEIEKRFHNGEQSLVFVNRLGFASYVQCRSCGEGFECPNCSVSLKYFKKTETLNCSFCDYKIPFPEYCPSCGNLKLIQKGFGTEKLEDVLRKKIPKLRIGRFDRDNIKNFASLKKMLNDFKEKKLDVLVGTQMLSKGHDFSSVNLVVVLGIDSQLNFPDFRSNERVFQLLTQISGRPGRSEKQGMVMIETLSPDNRIFKKVKSYLWQDLYSEEFEIRKTLKNPPFSRLCSLYFSSRFRQRAKEASEKATLFFHQLNRSRLKDKGLELMGPRPLIIEKRANMFTWTILLKSLDIGALHLGVSLFKENLKFHQSIAVKIDIDPLQLN